MKFRQTITALGITCIAALGLSLAAAGTAKAEWVKVTFLHTNDVYEISADDGIGGLAQLQTLISAEKANNKNTVITFGGDLLSPSVMSALTKGRQMIDLFNQLGTQFAVPGNHEFDFGPEVAAERFQESKFDWLAANVKTKGGEAAFGLQDSAIVEFDGIKVGIFGIAHPNTGVLSSPGDEIEFGDPVAVSKAQVEALKEAGADAVVALVHLDFAADLALIKAVSGIDLVLSGHDHVSRISSEGRGLVAEGGYDAHELLAVDMWINKYEKRGKIRVDVEFSSRFASTRAVAADPRIAASVASYEEKLDAELGEVIGETSSELDSQRATVRFKESNLGNLITDAMRSSTDADVAVTNGGGIRGDKVYPVGVEITRKDILSELPFGNVTVVLEVDGKTIREMLEIGVSKIAEGAGRFPQVSGLRFTFDPSKPSGSRVGEIMLGGSALDEGKTYRLATNDYMARGGDGYDVLKGAKTIVDASAGTLMASTVINYITALGGKISYEAEGRIIQK